MLKSWCVCVSDMLTVSSYHWDHCSACTGWSIESKLWLSEVLFLFNNNGKFYITFNGSVNTTYESSCMLRIFIILQEKRSIFVLKFLVIMFVTVTKFHFFVYPQARLVFHLHRIMGLCWVYLNIIITVQVMYICMYFFF